MLAFQECGLTMPDEKGSSLKLGRAAFEDANAADKSGALDTVAMLRSNRAAEAEIKLSFPPWYRNPFYRNLCWFLPIASVAGGKTKKSS